MPLHLPPSFSRSELFKQLLYIVRQCRLKRHFRARDRMRKCQISRMQRLARYKLRFLTPVKRVSGKGMACMRHVYAYLMRAARLKPQLKKRKSIFRRKYAVGAVCAAVPFMRYARVTAGAGGRAARS